MKNPEQKAQNAARLLRMASNPDGSVSLTPAEAKQLQALLALADGQEDPLREGAVFDPVFGQVNSLKDNLAHWSLVQSQEQIKRLEAMVCLRAAPIDNVIGSLRTLVESVDELDLDSPDYEDIVGYINNHSRYVLDELASCLRQEQSL